jgi:hypothetical protein
MSYVQAIRDVADELIDRVREEELSAKQASKLKDKYRHQARAEALAEAVQLLEHAEERST